MNQRFFMFMVFMALVATFCHATKDAQPQKTGNCQKLPTYILSICGESCDPKNGAKVAAECEKRVLTEEDIKGFCCPN